jgi:hypothetical protein
MKNIIIISQEQSTKRKNTNETKYFKEETGKTYYLIIVLDYVF